MRRDHGRCWMCGLTDLERPVIEHLRPRSNFLPHEVEFADRSDNLAIACWDCNAAKGNRDVPYRKPLRIVWYCMADYDFEAEEVDDEWFTAWCDSCQAAALVPRFWPTAGLEHWGSR